ncbi:MAG: DUF1800 domain-containing protein [Chloroflexota bacterium]
MADREIQLMAHLMRRAAFGATYEELETRAAKGYQATVEELLHPEKQPDLEMDLLQRYFIDWKEMNALEVNQAYLAYRMINTKRPLQEKVALFWHGILCTGNSKCEHGKQIQVQLDMFRRLGMGSFSSLLTELSRDPAMVFYLDNCMSHKGAINENYGRELLELFSMGVGMDGRPNYTEEDVKVCARAFTGWTIANAIPRYPYGRYESQFAYNSADHDDSEKTFLGETGRWNGEDVIDIIAKQPATARFIARHLYNFFVADEPQVPAWQNSPPRDPKAIRALEEAYFRSNYDISSMLRVLFNSDFFKNARFAKVKSPAEAVIGTMRLVGDFTSPKPGIHPIAMEIRYMGQDLMNPPTVEGWHTGPEWIDSGTLVERINFAADQLGNTDLPGVRAIIDRLRSEGDVLSPEHLLRRCLDMLGAYELPEETHSQLVAHAKAAGELRTGSEEFAGRVGQMLQLIVATQEYQFA